MDKYVRRSISAFLSIPFLSLLGISILLLLYLLEDLRIGYCVSVTWLFLLFIRSFFWRDI